MILVFVVKDIDIMEAGYNDANYNQQTFGIAYAWYAEAEGTFPKLGKNEDLFITAHGNAREIGDEGPTLSLAPKKVADTIKVILPAGYTGRIYLSVCNSYPFAQQVKNVLQTSVHQVQNFQVYGVQKAIGYRIEGPNHQDWRAA